jgi:hypothetical protein
MPTLQTNFGAAIPVGYPGMIANGELQNRLTRTCEDAAGIAFGAAVFDGAGDGGCTATPSANLLGIAVVDHGNLRLSGQTADRYARYENVPIMQRGSIRVLNGAASVTKRQPVYVTPAGAYTNVSAGNTALTGWTFDHAAAAGAIVRIVKNRG